MHFILLSVLSALLILSAPAAADERTVSLQEAYNLALKNHESVKVAGEVLYQLELTRKKAVSNILPVITADGSYTKFSDEKVSSITVIQPDNSLNYSLRLSLPLYRGGREWSALRQARHMIEAGERGAE
ncbi:MAG TPA: TolC family protein, partial [Nitrospirota bacterium]